MTTVREELEKVTGLKQKRNEEDQEYRSRLADTVDTKVSDKDWDRLSEQAREWVNAAMKSMDGDKPIVGFPDDKSDKNTRVRKTKEEAVEEEEVEEEEEAAEEEEAEEEEEEAEETKPKKKGVKDTKSKTKKVAESSKKDKKPVKKEVTKKEVKKEEVKVPVKKERGKSPGVREIKQVRRPKSGPSGSVAILHLVADNPDASFAEIKKLCEKKELALAEPTMRIRYYITKSVLDHLKERGVDLKKGLKK